MKRLKTKFRAITLVSIWLSAAAPALADASKVTAADFLEMNETYRAAMIHGLLASANVLGTAAVAPAEARGFGRGAAIGAGVGAAALGAAVAAGAYGSGYYGPGYGYAPDDGYYTDPGYYNDGPPVYQRRYYNVPGS
jgi:hypothetical protein